MTDTAQNNSSLISSQKTKSPNCLVVGAAGSLGSNLCQALLAQNCRIFGVDDLSSGKKSNIEKLESLQLFNFIDHNINDGLPENLPKFDYIFHLAGVEEFLNNEQLSFQSILTNSIGTHNLINRAINDNSVFLLVSIIDVYSGILSSLSLENYFGTTSREIGHYSHHEAKRFAEALVAQYHKLKNLNARIVRVTDLYGPKMNLESGHEIVKILKAALNNQEIKIAGDGLKIIHPTYFGDVVYGIIKAAFSSDTNGKIFSLVNPEEITLLNFAYAAKKIATQINNNFQQEVIFEDKEKISSIPAQKISLGNNEAQIGWQPKYQAREGIKLTLESFSQDKDALAAEGLERDSRKIEKSQKLDRFFKLLKSSKEKDKKRYTSTRFVYPNQENGFGQIISKSKIIYSLLAVFLLIVILFPVRIGAEIIYAAKSAEEAKRLLIESKFEKSKQKANRANWIFDKLHQELNLEKKIIPKDIGDNLTKSIIVAKHGTIILSFLADNGSNINLFTKAVLNPNSEEDKIKSDYDLIRSNTGYIINQLSIAKALANKINPNFLPFNLASDQIKNLKNDIEIADRYLTDANAILNLYPKISGFDKPKKYLVLFQNNLEIRPTGGFIGSYGVIDFENGHLKKITIDDIYNIDGQLQEEILPPEPLKKYLKIDRLYLRDANWNPNFPTSVLLIKDLFKKETDLDVDGVIAIDVTFLEGLLVHFGPIYLSHFMEEITSKNVYKKSQFHVEIGFSPGSQQKKNFLSELANEILKKLLKSDSNFNFLNVGNEIFKQLNQRHILVKIDDQKINQFIVNKNWSGELIKQPQNRTNFDYLNIVDANVGANKSNFFVDKKIFFQPTIKRDGDFFSKLIIYYKNNSPAETWPGGTYKNFLQVLVPPGSVLQSIENGENKDFSQVTVGNIIDKTSFGFLVQVEPQKEKKVILEYKQAVNVAFEDDQAEYELYIQKQPGTKNDLLEVKLNFPSYFIPIKSIPEGQASSQTIVYKTNLETDKVFNVKFKQ